MADDVWLPTLLEAYVQGLVEGGIDLSSDLGLAVERGINGVLLDERISFEMINGEMIAKELRAVRRRAEELRDRHFIDRPGT
jgi:hypothetical protein